ncbi:MAG: CsoS2 family carboxysome shell protein [Verrucomicrobiota bacterium]
MQTTTGNSEMTRGVMPHAAPANGNGKRWENRSKRRANGHAAPTPPRYEDLRPAPAVVNGRCEFGQCEDDAPQADAGSTPPPAAPAAPSASNNAPASGFGVPREQHAQRVVVRRAPRNTPRNSAPPPRIERPAPVVNNGRCEFGQCEAPAKVEEMTTGRGQIVTGNNVERSAKVTGNEPGTCKNVTGTGYIGPDQYQQFCDAQPQPGPAKVGAARTAKNKTVTGTQVGRSAKVTGDEPGSCKSITGDEYLNPAAADVPCAGDASPGPAKVALSRTSHGRGVTGTLVGRSGKVTGDEYGACEKITGTEYIGAELQQEFCGSAPAPAPDKVGVARTWLGQNVSGAQVGRSVKVTGDEYGACKPVTGTPYIGADSYQEFCDSGAQREAAARAKPVSGTPGHAMTGIQPGVKGKMTGDERGACQGVTGTPYLGADQYAQSCGGSVPNGVSGAFSVVVPARAAQQSRVREVTGTAYGGGARITGPLAKSAGVVTGTAEFRYPAHHETSAAQAAPQAAQQTEAKPGRITGEGEEARRITGDDWARNSRVTGTEGFFARARNLTQRGNPRGAGANAQRFREVEHVQAPPSKITGSSGNTVGGSVITVSGGARG